jgi:ADP-heptose:LPS heptosyltransferase
LKRNRTKNTEMRLLVIRTSAMGDVAFTTPVLSGFKRQYPGIELVLLTRAAFKPFFSNCDGIALFLPDLKGRHKGFMGIFRLYRDLQKDGGFDHVIDLHDVLRSRILGILFLMKGIKVTVIDKGRTQKRNLIKGKYKEALKHSVLRYADTFERAGFPVKLAAGPWIIPKPETLSRIDKMLTAGDINIGVAPYAKHDLKMWPEDHMIKLLRMLAEKQTINFWLFGGKEDFTKLEAFQKKVKGSFNTAGNMSLDEELALMSRLDLMIAMDSSNMHMAALVGTKVISIWGGTDPLTGFGAWQQPDENAIRIPVEELNCRPCTVFGKGKCKRGDFACMIWLTPEKVYDKLVNLKIL